MCIRDRFISEIVHTEDSFLLKLYYKFNFATEPDYEYIKSGKALRDKDEQIQNKQKQFDDLMNVTEKLEKNYKIMKEFTNNMEKAVDLVKVLLKELERLLGRDAYAKRINELTEDNSKIRQVATTVDKYMNPEYYPKEQKEEQQQRQRGMSR